MKNEKLCLRPIAWNRISWRHKIILDSLTDFIHLFESLLTNQITFNWSWLTLFFKLFFLFFFLNFLWQQHKRKELLKVLSIDHIIIISFFFWFTLVATTIIKLWLRVFIKFILFAFNFLFHLYLLSFDCNESRENSKNCPLVFALNFVSHFFPIILSGFLVFSWVFSEQSLGWTWAMFKKILLFCKFKNLSITFLAKLQLFFSFFLSFMSSRLRHFVEYFSLIQFLIKISKKTFSFLSFYQRIKVNDYTNRI